MDTTLDSYPAGRLGLEVVLSGKADFGTVADTPITFAVLIGKLVGVIAAISQVDHAELLSELL